MSNDGFASPAANAEGTATMQPERDLQAGDPGLSGAASPEEKKGIKGRVKGLMSRRSRKKDNQNSPRKASRVKEKLSLKVGHGEDGEKHGPAGLLPMLSGSSTSSSDEDDFGTVGFALDPTGPPVAGHNLGRRDFTSAPAGPGTDFCKLDLNSHADSPAERHASRAAEYAKWSTVANPRTDDNRSHPPIESNGNGDGGVGERSHSSGDALGSEHSLSPRSNSNVSGRDDASFGGVDDSRPLDAGISKLNPSEEAFGESRSETDDANRTATSGGEPLSAGMTTSESGAVVGDHHEGPGDDNAKPKSFMSSIVGTFRSPKGGAATATPSPTSE